MGVANLGTVGSSGAIARGSLGLLDLPVFVAVDSSKQEREHEAYAAGI